MRSLSIFVNEWKHFTRSPFKIIALFLFTVASIYGLHNGADLFEKQKNEIERLNQETEAEIKNTLSYFDTGKKGPDEKPWVDNNEPFWAIYNAPTYQFKTPSPTIVYAIGQTEQYGFYKRITTWSNPYDADMTQEISNPERIQSGNLDFSFAVLFLLPLLLLVLLYNIKGLEAERGFLPLVIVQAGSKNWWILSRTAFYAILLLLVLFGLMLYGATLTDVFETKNDFWKIFLWVTISLLFWLVIYFLILYYGNNTVSNTLQMIGVWLLLALIIPATIQQWIAIEKPTNLMVDLIDVKREKTSEIYEQSKELIDAQLLELYPDLKETKTFGDTTIVKNDRGYSTDALVNIEMKNATKSIEADNYAKNKLVETTYWFNPLTYFQNKLNKLTSTHYEDYESYRNEIQKSVDNRLETMVFDIWNNVEVDKLRYLEYNAIFSNDK
jgi:ABC-2 type transport system permease protein